MLPPDVTAVYPFAEAMLTLSAFNKYEKARIKLVHELRSAAADPQHLSSYKETQWEASRHKQELEQETMKGTRTGE